MPKELTSRGLGEERRRVRGDRKILRDFVAGVGRVYLSLVVVVAFGGYARELSVCFFVLFSFVLFLITANPSVLTDCASSH